ncbi:HsdM family class I SAM-dependent methyltransferase [Bacillus sp. Au-Bac7]|uniref:HsdM family class I SAM-dependent methyltransferase n=1 Tax=Bacillus sp. Au-Bac7 TaxID=2906458 RepID=UPI001E4168E0|nr:N-6 DNA methylase [Bacillus sp. Au-Bac7]MCE4051946.1 N-6 DNA methylase [Bacillus sp. Au-Bac7]
MVKQIKHTNERITEDLLDELFANLGYKQENIHIEKQISADSRIKKLLKNASKSGNGKGSPEHIITIDGYPEFLIITECKADIKYHESQDLANPKDFAVDGVIHYMNYLSKEFNVIGIAASGMTKDKLLISTFFLGKGLTSNKLTRLPDEKILPINDYIKAWQFDPNVKKQQKDDLIKFSKLLHNYLRDYAKLSENEKPLLVSAILLALEDPSFEAGYEKSKHDAALSRKIIQSISEILEENDLHEDQKNKILSSYSFIQAHPELTKRIEDTKKRVLLNLVKQIDENIMPFIRIHQDMDMVGQFYGEFLRYTGGDKKALGIVLTPQHITELFAELAELTPQSKVLDTCAGTGGFLIACAAKMISLVGNDSEAMEEITQNNLIGVEQQPNMFTLGAANMLLRKYGMQHSFQDNSFDLKGILTALEPDVGTINPPYAQKGEGLSELEYIEFLLDCVKKDGKVFAIVPISCAIAPSPAKSRLLKSHTLEAVMSMPNDLFYPVGTYTCIMVFTAKKPHPSNKETWFAYWKDDGFEKTKNSGRLDVNGTWEITKDHWVDMYTNKSEIVGVSVKHKVTSDDEWCAEAYMETDYSDLVQEDFEAELERFITFKMANKGRLI